MITINSQLDMTPGAIPVVIHRSQYDSDFAIVFTLFARTGNFTIASGTTARVRGTKKTGTGYSADATIDVSAKIVTVTGDQQMTAVSGQNIFEIVLMSGTKELCSANFILDVERAALDMDTITDDTVARELDNLDQFVADAEAAADRAEDAAATFSVDATLAVSGKAADAKKTGDSLADKVDKVSGKGLSTEDYTTEEKTKLAGIETGATKTTIDSTLTVTGNAADAKAVGDAIASEDKKALAAFATDTATGAVASFHDGAGNIPMKDVLVHIEPVQEGSGDPSPDNVRPITGWTGAKVARTGKNLLPPPVAETFTQNGVTVTASSDGSYTAMGTTSGGSYIHKFALSEAITIKDGMYWHVMNDDPRVTCSVALISGGKNIRDITLAPKNRIIDLSELAGKTVEAYQVYVANNQEANITLKPMFVLNSTTTDYEPYSGQAYDITFPSEAGTVYGVTLDVTKGELVVDRANIASYNGETLPGEWISDRDVYVAGTTPTAGAQVVYKLATPITYHLTPQEITSLLGANNLWADTGDSEVEYRADTKLYITKKITEAVSALS